MAKRKKAHGRKTTTKPRRMNSARRYSTTRRRRSRRMNAARTQVGAALTNTGMLVLGYVGAEFAKNAAAQVVKDPIVRDAIATGVGLAVAVKMPKLAPVGYGFALSGGVGLVRAGANKLGLSMPVLNGARMTTPEQRRAIHAKVMDAARRHRMNGTTPNTLNASQPATLVGVEGYGEWQ